MSERMMRLGRNYWDENEAISVIPPYIEVFSKTAALTKQKWDFIGKCPKWTLYFLYIY